MPWAAAVAAGRKREILADEAEVWLAILLDYAFSLPVGHQGRANLLAIASDINLYPHDIPASRAAELLLLWSEKWVSADDWSRLKARVRKRRSRS